MRKLFYLMALSGVALMVAACGQHGENKEMSTETDSTARVDSIRMADSIAAVEAAKAAQAQQDSLRQDSIAKDEAKANDAAQYDGLLKEYESAVSKYEKFARNLRTSGGNGNNQASYTTKCINLYTKLNKAKSKMTPEQKKKFQSLYNKYNNAYYSING